jgi:hypothetical protein
MDMSRLSASEAYHWSQLDMFDEFGPNGWDLCCTIFRKRFPISLALSISNEAENGMSEQRVDAEMWQAVKILDAQPNALYREAKKRSRRLWKPYVKCLQGVYSSFTEQLMKLSSPVMDIQP